MTYTVKELGAATDQLKTFGIEHLIAFTVHIFFLL